MTCAYHATPIEDCCACAGRWDRAMAERAIDGYGISGIAEATLRMAIAEIDRLYGLWVQVSQWGHASADEAVATYEPMRAEIARLREDLDHATAADGDHLSKASRRMCETVLGDRDALRAKVREQAIEIETLRFCDNLGLFHDGEMSTEQADAFREHLTRCQRCPARLVGLAQEAATFSTGEVNDG